jgi:hypothetical protein
MILLFHKSFNNLCFESYVLIVSVLSENIMPFFRSNEHHFIYYTASLNPVHIYVRVRVQNMQVQYTIECTVFLYKKILRLEFNGRLKTF